MGNKTIFIFVIIALSATVVLQNTGSVSLTFLWAYLNVAKSTIILGALATGFIAGIVITRSNTPNDDNAKKNSDDENYLN
jgi:uncharacterized integral membrane protein